MAAALDRSVSAQGRRGVLPLAVAITLVLAAAAGMIGWLASSGPLPPPAVTVAIPKPSGADAGPAEPVPVPAAELPAAPVALVERALVEDSPNGPLPMIAHDGRMPWQVYARPFDMSDKRPRIAIVIDDLASSVSLTHDAIQNLPPAVSLSFMPYRRNLADFMGAARQAGHELLLDLPMEPPDIQHHDLGPNALRTALDAPTNVGRLDWMMGRTGGYVGMAAFMGGRFTADRGDLEPILVELRKRGLLFIDNAAASQSVAPAIAAEIGLPFAAAAVQLDADPTRDEVDQKLAELEQDALRDGRAVGIAAASEAVLERVGSWSGTLASRHLVLAPISAVVVATRVAWRPAATAAAAKN